MSSLAQPVTKGRTKGSPAFMLWLAILGLLTVGGIVAWAMQTTRGFVVTGLRDTVPWGLYIVGFVFCTGLSAGSLILAAVPHVFDLPGYKPHTKFATLAALSSVVAAGLFITADVGQPAAMWRMIVHGRIGSPMFWDMLILTAYVVLSVLFLLQLRAADGSMASDGRLKRWGYAVLVAGLLDGATAFVFGFQIARHFWNSALQPVAFVVTAVGSATALLLLLGLGLHRSKQVTTDEDSNAKMGKLMAFLMTLELLFLISEIVTAAFPAADAGMDPIHWLVLGAGAPLFWTEVIAGFLAIVLAVLPATRRKPALLGLAAGLVLVSAFLKRFTLVLAGFVPSPFPTVGVVTGPAPATQGTFLQGLADRLGYFPSLVEWSVALGVLAAGGLVLALGLKWLAPADR